ncbi:tRNA 2-selenouridine(34) synthase MnmH [Parasulfuritortus cantonensis]|uniref:tRNA 2-selenouridine(34) synthase MnmH n=1 Tax=Parasulfuritortus cantonensis TaxID=2528202 RepID=A0A4R1BDQ4_9PROT|nr:tRNA 2-selenouridine(34) synthase MnmH [Parasulfuritortus cantonensis]TCJ15167.1 tRNA 2-selenouridine(34) synthase MnmH [Parasulfuritortus cantonensis]
MICADGRAPRGRPEIAGLDELDAFDEVIDVRSPGEYADDHIPGAVNLPVLDDAERARVGTLYKQVSPFEAKRLGAALVSRNIASHLENHFAAKGKTYRPLVYCWRGGTRSGSLSHVLRSVGWQAAQLAGGYKAYRGTVLADLERLPEGHSYTVVCGPTGVGKSRFLRALAGLGGQVLDLEDLAAHMGSVLGAYPSRPQPPQKLFESLVWDRLCRFDPDRPVYVESESKRIGDLHTPEILLRRMRASPCLNLTAPVPVRVALLKEEYAHLMADPARLGGELDRLIQLRGRDTVTRWKALAAAGRWDELVADLLEQHYDPAYRRSLGQNFVLAEAGPTLELAAADPEYVGALARGVLDGILATA